jgi:hypothetical protein
MTTQGKDAALKDAVLRLNLGKAKSAGQSAQGNGENAGRKASGLPGRRRRERLSYIFVRNARMAVPCGGGEIEERSLDCVHRKKKPAHSSFLRAGGMTT